MSTRRALMIGFLLALALPVGVGAQATNIRSGSALPTNCRAGDVYIKTSATAGPYYCSTAGSPGTWTLIGVATQTATVTLTDAQIKALPTTPIQLIAAPAAGFFNHVFSATLVKTATAGAYTNISTGANNVLRIEDASGNYCVVAIANDSTFTIPMTRLTNFLGGANVRVVTLSEYAEAIQEATQGDFGWISPPVGATAADHSAKAVNLALTNSGGNLTGGNAANTLKVTVYYSVEAL